MTSKAARKRMKRARQISLPGGEVVEMRASAGRPPADDPMKAVLSARERLLADAGVKTPADHARSPLAGCQVGLKLLADDLTPDDRAALWGAVCHMRRVWVAYDRACGAPSRHAQCLSILAPAEHFGTSSDAPAFDDRPQEDKDRAAVAAYMRAQGWLMCGANADRSATVSAVIDDAPIYDWAAVKRGLGLVAKGLSGTKA